MCTLSDFILLVTSSPLSKISNVMITFFIYFMMTLHSVVIYVDIVQPIGVKEILRKLYYILMSLFLYFGTHIHDDNITFTWVICNPPYEIWFVVYLLGLGLFCDLDWLRLFYILQWNKTFHSSFTIN